MVSEQTSIFPLLFDEQILVYCVLIIFSIKISLGHG